MKRINIERDKCISCFTCESACRFAHDAPEPRLRVMTSKSGDNTPIICRHCDEPECVYTCMTGAMSKDKETGLVDYDADHCASCYMCVMACPYGVLKPDDRTKKEILKCDMCKEHESQTPQCVANCPMGAITLKEVE